MHTVFALLCFVVVIHWLIFPYPSGLLHWHCGNLTIAPVPAKQPWWIWIDTSCEFIMNDCIATTKQSTTKPCVYFLGYTVCFICVITLMHVHIMAMTTTATKQKIPTYPYRIKSAYCYHKLIKTRKNQLHIPLFNTYGKPLRIISYDSAIWNRISCINKK